MNHLTLTLLLALAIFSTAQNSYANFTTLQNPHQFNSVVWASDLKFVMLYGEQALQGTAYRAYDWLPLQDETLVRFEFAPKNVEFFTDGQHQTNLLYSNSQGKVRRRIYNSAGYTELNLFSVPEESNNTDIARATASSDGSLYAMFCEGDSLVYIGDLRKQVTLVEILDFTEQGPVSNIRWRPGTTELIISGGSGDNRYFQKYDTTTKKTEDWVFLANGPVSDMAFNVAGDVVYFLQAPEGEQNDVQQIIWKFNVISKDRVDFIEELLPKAVNRIEIRGNFLSARNDETEYVWSLVDGASKGSYESSMTTSGLSPDGSDLINIIQTEASKFSVRKLCGDRQHIYDAPSNSCLSCQEPCLTCFTAIDHCSSCEYHYFWKDDFTCGQCSLGCRICQSEEVCSRCDIHWALDENKKCVCADKYVMTIDQECQACTNFMQGCLLCSATDNCLTCQAGFALTHDKNCQHCSNLIEGCNVCSSPDTCTQCADGYSLSADSHKCEQQSGNSTVIIIIIVVAVVILIIVGVLVWRWKSKKSKKLESALESQAMEDYEKVEDER